MESSHVLWICSFLFIWFQVFVDGAQHVHLSLSSSSSQMNVAWWTADEEPGSFVKYGTSKNEYDEEVPASTKKIEKYGSGFMHFATMISLAPKMKYYYRVGNQTSLSKEFYFRSKPDDKLSDDDKVRMIAFGDAGVESPAMETYRVLKSREIAREASDLVLHVGDLAYAFENTTKWDMWFTAAEDIAAHVPYMISFGNRDTHAVFEERFSMPLDRESNSILRKDYNSQNFYYSFDYGWVHVVSINYSADAIVDWHADSPLYKWLENDLRQASSRLLDSHESLRWIVLMGHMPMYSSSNGHGGGDKVFANQIEHLLVKYNVSLCLWGDDHMYERSYPIYRNVSDTSSKKVVGGVHHFESPNKPIHLLVGTGGIGLDGYLSPDAPAWSAYREINHGYVKLVATKNTLEIEFIRQKGGVVGDRAIILKAIPGTVEIHWFLIAIPVFVVLLFVGRRKRFFSRIIQGETIHRSV